MTPKELGAKWSAARTAKGHTIEHVAHTLSLHVTDLRAVEAGESAPTLTMLIACAQMYGVREQDLLG